MKILIVGCGRLGSGLAEDLANEGHDITVISHVKEQFQSLESVFQGILVEGVEFDREVLEKAGIATADSLIACTESDVTNALVARIARNNYQVPKVIARLYEQRKVTIYNALGIQVIATTNWGITRAKELLTFNHLDTVASVGNAPVEILKVHIPTLLAGTRIREAFPMAEVRIVALTRGNETMIPSNEHRLAKDDLLYVAVLPESIDKLKRVLSL